ncbi:hypothetical protein [Streptomyces sp. NPDC059918]|uniref:hypothetical protein n=1 Tax=unclassified Streptomyces TaxID=2593676 RepID=UPI00365011D7
MELKSAPEILSELSHELATGSVTRRSLFWHLHLLRLNHVLEGVLQAIDFDASANAEFVRLTGCDSTETYKKSINSESDLQDIDTTFTGEQFPCLVRILGEFFPLDGDTPGNVMVSPPRPDSDSVQPNGTEFAQTARKAPRKAPRKDLTKARPKLRPHPESGRYNFTGPLTFGIRVDGADQGAINDFDFAMLGDLGIGEIAMKAAVDGHDGQKNENGNLLHPTAVKLVWNGMEWRHSLSLDVSSDLILQHNVAVLKNVHSGAISVVCHGKLLLLVDSIVVSPLAFPAEFLAKFDSVQQFHIVRGSKGGKEFIVAPSGKGSTVQRLLGDLAKDVALALVYK